MSDIFGIGQIGASTIGAISANHAADLQYKSTQAAIAQQKSQYDTTRADQAPWLAAGRGALDQLTAGTAPGGSLVTPFGEQYQQPAAFVAPTLDNTNDPGYAFRQQQGEQAIQRGAAASGGAVSGGTLKALARYGQDYASNEYNNVYNRALTGYQTNFADNLTGYQTRFNAYNTGQTNTYNRLASLAGNGQTAANQLAASGQQNSSAVSDLLTQGGNARAAGSIGVAGAINNGVQGAINNYQNGSLINALTGGSGGGGRGVVGTSLPSNGWYEPGGGGYQPGDTE